MTSPLPPLLDVPVFPPRVSEMRAYRVSCIARPAAGGAPARPVTLTIWALGMSMALILAQRQLDSLALTSLGSLSCHQA
jgi:hypothetical protein